MQGDAEIGRTTFTSESMQRAKERTTQLATAKDETGDFRADLSLVGCPLRSEITGHNLQQRFIYRKSLSFIRAHLWLKY
jgi:hypothetical protein